MDFTFLKDLMNLPTAPFRESHVIARIRSELDAYHVPHFTDVTGNVVVGAETQAAYLKKVNQSSREPVRLFIAHTDHPGFHGVEWKRESVLQAKWFGGAPLRLLKGQKVWLADRGGVVGVGKIFQAKLNPRKTSLETLAIQTEKGFSKLKPDAGSLFGGFRFRAPVWKTGKIWRTKCADDFVGVATIISLAKKLWSASNASRDNFLAILTRAEEVGLIGAIAHFELGWLNGSQRPVVCVSLETSRTLPGAFVGAGPVVRLGDRVTTFDAGAIQIMSDIAERVLPKQHQRRLMDGGTCEGTVATTFGFTTLGISVPLGNYHNESYEGGPDAKGKRGPAPEFVHENDMKGMYLMAEALVEPGLGWGQPFKNRRESFLKRRHESQQLLNYILEA